MAGNRTTPLRRPPQAAARTDCATRSTKRLGRHNKVYRAAAQILVVREALSSALMGWSIIMQWPIHHSHYALQTSRGSHASIELRQYEHTLILFNVTVSWVQVFCFCEGAICDNYDSEKTLYNGWESNHSTLTS